MRPDIPKAFYLVFVILHITFEMIVFVLVKVSGTTIFINLVLVS